MNRQAPVLQQDQTVLVLLEFQQQWTRPGLFHWLIHRELTARNVILNAERATEYARSQGIPVVHAPLIVDPKHKRGLYAWLTQGLFFRKGSAAAKLDPRIYQPGDVVAQGRTAFDAFIGSDLLQCLNDTGRNRLLLAGFATDQCVARSAVSARKMGFETWLLTDASATFAAALQRRAERSFAGKVLSVAEWLQKTCCDRVSSN